MCKATLYKPKDNISSEYKWNHYNSPFISKQEISDNYEIVTSINIDITKIKNVAMHFIENFDAKFEYLYVLDDSICYIGDL